MALPRFILRQLANPSGLTGRLILRCLNKANRGMNAMPLHHLPISRTDQALEVGFGGGALLDQIGRAGPSSLVGVETSVLAIKVATRRHRKDIDRGVLQLVQSDAASMPFGDEQFSKIYCVNVIYFWPDPDRVFRELHRVMARSGHLALCYEQQGPDRTATYSPSQIECSLLEAGFVSPETTTARDNHNEQYHCTIASRR